MTDLESQRRGSLSEHNINTTSSSSTAPSNKHGSFNSSDFEVMSLTSSGIPEFVKQQELEEIETIRKQFPDKEAEWERKYKIAELITKVMLWLLPYPDFDWDMRCDIEEFIFLTTTRTKVHENVLFHALYLLQRFSAVYCHNDILPHPREIWMGLLILSCAHVEDRNYTHQAWSQAAGPPFTWMSIANIWFQLLEQLRGMIGGPEARRVTMEWSFCWETVDSKEKMPHLDMLQRLKVHVYEEDIQEEFQQEYIDYNVELYPWEFYDEEEESPQLIVDEIDAERVKAERGDIDSVKKEGQDENVVSVKQEEENETVDSIFAELYKDIAEARKALAQEMSSIFDN